MKTHESVEIAARPEEVWVWLANPERLAAWHAKLVEVRRTGSGPAYAGEKFDATYVMNDASDKRQTCTTEVLRCEPWTTLILRHHFQVGDRPGYVDETYQLHPRGDGSLTWVEQAVDFGHAGMPRWVRALMWCITRFGQPTGEGILTPLKRACETGNPAANQFGVEATEADISAG